MKEISEFFSWIGVALVTLLPIVNPLSTAALLMAIGTHLTVAERNRQVMRACLYMAGILIVFCWEDI